MSATPHPTKSRVVPFRLPCMSLDVSALVAAKKAPSRQTTPDTLQFPADENFWRCLQRLISVIPGAQDKPTFDIEGNLKEEVITVNRAFLTLFRTAWAAEFPLWVTVVLNDGGELKRGVFSAHAAVWYEILLRSSGHAALSLSKNRIPPGICLCHSSADESEQSAVCLSIADWGEVCSLWPEQYPNPEEVKSKILPKPSRAGSALRSIVHDRSSPVVASMPDAIRAAQAASSPPRERAAQQLDPPPPGYGLPNPNPMQQAPPQPSPVPLGRTDASGFEKVTVGSDDGAAPQHHHRLPQGESPVCHLISHQQGSGVHAAPQVEQARSYVQPGSEELALPTGAFPEEELPPPHHAAPATSTSAVGDDSFERFPAAPDMMPQNDEGRYAAQQMLLHHPAGGNRHSQAFEEEEDLPDETLAPFGSNSIPPAPPAGGSATAADIAPSGFYAEELYAPEPESEPSDDGHHGHSRHHHHHHHPRHAAVAEGAASFYVDEPPPERHGQPARGMVGTPGSGYAVVPHRGGHAGGVPGGEVGSLVEEGSGGGGGDEPPVAPAYARNVDGSLHARVLQIEATMIKQELAASQREIQRENELKISRLEGEFLRLDGEHRRQQQELMMLGRKDMGDISSADALSPEAEKGYGEGRVRHHHHHHHPHHPHHPFTVSPKKKKESKRKHQQQHRQQRHPSPAMISYDPVPTTLTDSAEFHSWGPNHASSPSGFSMPIPSTIHAPNSTRDARDAVWDAAAFLPGGHTMRVTPQPPAHHQPRALDGVPGSAAAATGEDPGLAAATPLALASGGDVSIQGLQRILGSAASHPHAPPRSASDASESLPADIRAPDPAAGRPGEAVRFPGRGFAGQRGRGSGDGSVLQGFNSDLHLFASQLQDAVAGRGSGANPAAALRGSLHPASATPVSRRSFAGSCASGSIRRAMLTFAGGGSGAGGSPPGAPCSVAIDAGGLEQLASGLGGAIATGSAGGGGGGSALSGHGGMATLDIQSTSGIRASLQVPDSIVEALLRHAQQGSGGGGGAGAPAPADDDYAAPDEYQSPKGGGGGVGGSEAGAFVLPPSALRRGSAGRRGSAAVSDASAAPPHRGGGGGGGSVAGGRRISTLCDSLPPFCPGDESDGEVEADAADELSDPPMALGAEQPQQQRHRPMPQVPVAAAAAQQQQQQVVPRQVLSPASQRAIARPLPPLPDAVNPAGGGERGGQQQVDPRVRCPGGGGGGGVMAAVAAGGSDVLALLPPRTPHPGGGSVFGDGGRQVPQVQPMQQQQQHYGLTTPTPHQQQQQMPQQQAVEGRGVFGAQQPQMQQHVGVGHGMAPAVQVVPLPSPQGLPPQPGVSPRGGAVNSVRCISPPRAAAAVAGATPAPEGAAPWQPSPVLPSPCEVEGFGSHISVCSSDPGHIIVKGLDGASRHVDLNAAAGQRVAATPAPHQHTHSHRQQQQQQLPLQGALAHPGAFAPRNVNTQQRSVWKGGGGGGGVPAAAGGGGGGPACYDPGTVDAAALASHPSAQTDTTSLPSVPLVSEASSSLEFSLAASRIAAGGPAPFGAKGMPGGGVPHGGYPVGPRQSSRSSNRQHPWQAFTNELERAYSDLASSR